MSWSISLWSRITSADERTKWHKDRWNKMPPGHRDQFLERACEAALSRMENLTDEQKRQLTKAARAKRWTGHVPLRSLTPAQRRKRRNDYQRKYRAELGIKGSAA